MLNPLLLLLSQVLLHHLLSRLGQDYFVVLNRDLEGEFAWDRSGNIGLAPYLAFYNVRFIFTE